MRAAFIRSAPAGGSFIYLIARARQELVEEFQAMEDDAQKDEVKLGKQLKSREDAKEALRAASRTQLKKAVKKVGMALKAAGGSKGLLNALAAAKDGGGEGGEATAQEDS